MYLASLITSRILPLINSEDIASYPAPLGFAKMHKTGVDNFFLQCKEAHLTKCAFTSVNPFRRVTGQEG